MPTSDITILMNDYYSELADIPPDTLALGIRALLNDNREWYHFPSIGNIRGYANTFTDSGILSADQAWRACLAGQAPADSLAFEIFNNLCLNRFDLARTSLEQVGFRQNTFIKSYQEALARLRSQEQLPRSVRQALAKPPREAIETDGMLNGETVETSKNKSDSEDVISAEEAKTRLRDIYAELAKRKAEREQFADDATLKHRKTFLKRQAGRILVDGGEHHEP
jgi:hypothetical protein